MKRADEFKPNIDRLVRSAMNDERYCSFILDCLQDEQFAMTGEELNEFWVRASRSDATVHEFIRQERHHAN